MCSACEGYTEFVCDYDKKDKSCLYLEEVDGKLKYIGMDTDEDNGTELTSVRFKKEKALLFASKMLELANQLDD